MKKKNYLQALFVLAACFLISFYGILGAIDRWGMDALYQTPSGTDNNIRIIAVDEKTLSEYGTFSSWSREKSAELISLLNGSEESKPAAIGFDIMFIGDGDPDTDAALANACKGSDNIITAVNIVNETVLESNGDDQLQENKMHIADVELPFEALRQNTRIGFANTAPDSDSYIRRAILYRSYEGERIDSFSSAVYQLYCANQGITPEQPKLGTYNEFLFSYSGKPGSYETVSLSDVLNGTVDPRTFRDCIVLVGGYAPGMQDAYNTPVDRSQQMYGVEIHANIIQALLEGNTLEEAGTMATALIIACLAAAYFLLLKKTKLMTGSLAGLLLIAAWMISGKLCYGKGWEVSLLTFPILLIVIYLTELISSYLEERLRRNRMVSAFKKYVAPQVVDELVKQDKFEITLGGENRDVAVLFVDIRGFTSMSEALSPEQVVDILNEYLTLTTSAIFDHGGTLDKFIGDATMGIFNAPFDLDDYVYKAILTALDIVNGTKELNDRLLERFGKTVQFGVGVHCGPAVVGNVGCGFRMDYTAIGDTVNTASRLEGSAAGGQVLISTDVYERLKDRIQANKIGNLRLKGKENELTVYEVTGVYNPQT